MQESSALPALHKPRAEEFQHYLWPASTLADTRLAHSSASKAFRQNNRRLLASTNTAAQAENGEGVIEYRPVGFNIDSGDFATFFAIAHANKKATGRLLVLETCRQMPALRPCNPHAPFMNCGSWWVAEACTQTWLQAFEWRREPTM